MHLFGHQKYHTGVKSCLFQLVLKGHSNFAVTSAQNLELLIASSTVHGASAITLKLNVSGNEALHRILSFVSFGSGLPTYRTTSSGPSELGGAPICSKGSSALA